MQQVPLACPSGTGTRPIIGSTYVQFSKGEDQDIKFAIDCEFDLSYH